MSRRGWLLFAAMCLVWGVPYLLIKVAVDDVSPAEVVLSRCTLGAAALLPWALRTGAVRQALGSWRPLVLFALVEMAGPWWLLSSAETRLPSSLTGLLVAGVPLVASVVGPLLGDADRLDRTRVLGLLSGVVGVVVLLGLDVSGGDGWALLAVALTVCGYAVGPMIVARRLSHVPAVGVNAVSLTLTALLFVPVSALQWRGLPGPRAALSLLALGLVCTALALVLFFALIAEAGPQRALVITFVNPAVAVLLGIALLGEPLTLGTVVGFPLVLLGCVLATRRSVTREVRPAPTPPLPAPAPTGAP